MIVLDTNVVSEAMKPAPDLAVRNWLNDQVAETLYLSSVTLAELLFGIAALPEGRRKKALADTLDGLLELFDDRVLSFDTAAARHYADLAATARAGGKDSRHLMDILRLLQPPRDLQSRHAIRVPLRRQESPSSILGTTYRLGKGRVSGSTGFKAKHRNSPRRAQWVVRSRPWPAHGTAEMRTKLSFERGVTVLKGRPKDLKRICHEVGVPTRYFTIRKLAPII